MDVLGGFAETGRGNKHILVIVDALTRYVELIPLKSKTAAECGEKFYSFFVCRYGLPEKIISDSGTEFNNAFINTLCEILGIKKVNTAVYNPASNGIVERVNRKILEVFRVTIGGDDPDWDRSLYVVMFALNNNYHSAIGTDPHAALYGCSARSPFDVLETRDLSSNSDAAVMKNNSDI